jgi:phenylacetic acid degradation operon negative regulatory protein
MTGARSRGSVSALPAPDQSRDRRSGALESDPAVGHWIRRQLVHAPPRAKSLVVTVWGDSIAPHGGAIWLSALIGLLEPFGINERLTRTSVYRLTQEGWLVSRQEGRRSLYRLTSQGRRRFEHAYRRIYVPPATDPWNGDWNLLIAPPSSIDESARRELRKELQWDGFGVVAPGVFARPARAGDASALEETVLALGISGRVAIANAHGLPRAAGSIASLSKDCWDLKSVAAAYRGFVARFRSVADALDAGATPDAQQCFVLRTLLIHEFRRVTLHDPQLPAELLPARWPEAAAYALCAALYRRVHRGAERYLADALRGSVGDRSFATARFQGRFGGLQAG